MEKEILLEFKEMFGKDPVIVRSPGRVNIIGEHTDYNEGFVLPAAIDRFIYVAVGKRDDNRIHLYSKQFNSRFECGLDEITPSKLQWPNYVIGIVDQLRKHGFAISGFDLVINGNIPIGAGLSSSAAVECATVFALNELFNFSIRKMEMVKMAQRAEHTFPGVMCGIMDQFASIFGKKDHCIKLDCRFLEFQYCPLKLDGIKIVLLNTNIKHSLSASEYNTRRQQCEQGVTWVREHCSGVNNLRDVDLSMLDKYVLPKDKLIYKRCRYVVEENLRLLGGCNDLGEGNISSLGAKMFLTHDGLSKDYEVSCKELDFLVNLVKTNPDVLGARMMGGGFGGCTINLVRENSVDLLVDRVSRHYYKELGIELEVYVANIENGTTVIVN